MDRLSEQDKAVLNVIFDPLCLMESSSQDDNIEDMVSDKVAVLPADVVEIVAKAMEASKNGLFEESLKLFDKARAMVPKSAAILNDRAQALRLVGRDDDALKDLDLAVELSEGHDKAGIQALCQRGVLHRCAGRTEEAKADFELAARGGSSFARAQVINLNPYAAMCNAMLREINATSSSLTD